MSTHFLSPWKILKRFRYLPLAIASTKNWAKFMKNYALGKTEGVYQFRNGGKLRIHSGFDHVPIIEVVMKKDYGTIRDGSTIVDIGASTGVFAVNAAASARNIRVYCYEPSAEYYSTLTANIKLNNAEEYIKPFNMAVAGSTEPRRIALRSSGFVYPSLVAPVEGNQLQEIRCTTLERIFTENDISHLDILKMDCEGAEYEIFRNTSDALMSRIKEIRMEYHNVDDDRNVDTLRELLKEKGFRETYFMPTNSSVGNIWFQPSHQTTA